MLCLSSNKQSVQSRILCWHKRAVFLSSQFFSWEVCYDWRILPFCHSVPPGNSASLSSSIRNRPLWSRSGPRIRMRGSPPANRLWDLELDCVSWPIEIIEQPRTKHYPIDLSVSVGSDLCFVMTSGDKNGTRLSESQFYSLSLSALAWILIFVD